MKGNCVKKACIREIQINEYLYFFKGNHADYKTANLASFF